MSKEIKCLDKGHVVLVDHMGNDMRVVDAARVSYQQGTKAIQSDRHLIRYLVRNSHTTPLEKVVFEFNVKCPLFIARQWMRHRTGSFNEISARYSEMKDEFYIPDPLRKQSSSNRQGSSDESVDTISIGLISPDTGEDFRDEVNSQQFIEFTNKYAYSKYEKLLNQGVAKELARGVLPVSMYTEFYWTVNLWNLMHFLRLRLDQHAQYEIRVFAEAIFQLLKDNCDLEYSLEAFQDYILDKPNISKYEIQILKESLIKNAGHTGVLKSIEKLIAASTEMSSREKAESKLVKLLSESEDE